MDTLKNLEKKINSELTTKINGSRIEYNQLFLNIDSEGSDHSVLQSFNLKKYQPDLICVETKDSAGKSNKDSNNIFEYLRKNNYNFIKQCGPSSFFQKVHSTGA